MTLPIRASMDVPPPPPTTVPMPPPPPQPPDRPPEVIEPVLPGEKAPVKDPPAQPTSPSGLRRAQFEHDLLQHRRLFADLELLRDDVCGAAEAMVQRVLKGGRIVFFGNGGAGAIAQLLASTLNTRLRHWPVAPVAMTLGHDPVAMAALARQHGIDDAVKMMMAVQIGGMVQRRDCAVALSTSGASDNVLAALQRARREGALTVGLLGRGGGRALSLVDHPVVVDHAHSARIHEAQLMIGHCWCAQIEGALTARQAPPLPQAISA